jgi:quercetin dioxygenase-like cupin family protein
MEISRTRPESAKGPADRFTGDVWFDPIDAGAPLPSRMRALSVHFTPGARTNWHTHPFGQVLYVLEGVGRTQSEGGPVQEIRAGDTVRFGPGENHWHGAAPGNFMTHLALQEADDEGVPAHWGEPVSDEDYLTEPASGAA